MSTAKAALLLVDVQNDFLPGGALAVPQGDAVIDVANRLAPDFDCVIATQDWHPPNHGSFAVSHPGRQVGDRIELDGLPQVLWPVHCVQNTRGAELAERLAQQERFTMFRKGSLADIDSYSGFFDNGHRQATGLDGYLRDQRVTDLFVLGLATDYCVKFTVLDACQLGFTTHVVQDGCRAVNLAPGDDARAFSEMQQAGAELIDSETIAREWFAGKDG